MQLNFRAEEKTIEFANFREKVQHVPLKCHCKWNKLTVDLKNKKHGNIVNTILFTTLVVIQYMYSTERFISKSKRLPEKRKFNKKQSKNTSI